MMLVKAIVRPGKMEAVREALERLDLSGITILEVRGHGRQQGHTTVYRGHGYVTTLLRRVEIDVVVGDYMVEEVVEAVVRAARTGEVGDGRVFVLPVAEAHNIRTGERNVI